MNTDADNTQNETTNAPALIESMKWQVNHPIRRAPGGYSPQISLSDIECEITRTVTQSACVNLTEVSDINCPQDDVYDWDNDDEDTEYEFWRVSGMVKQSDYSELMTRYTKLLDLARIAIPFIDLAKMQNTHLFGVSEE